MKNKFIIIFLILIINISYPIYAIAEDFTFEVTDLEILENGNVYKSNNRGKILTDNQIEVISNSFKYLKKTNKLEAVGDVKFFDIKNNIIINAEKIIYLKNEEKIYTLGKTSIKVSSKYNILGYDLVLLKDKLILSSDKRATITDNYSNIYKVNKFEYSINQEILKGTEIEVTTNYKKTNSDKYFFETGFFDLKQNKFLAKDISVEMHKALFGDDKNDPRISAVSGYGDEFNTYFEKGIFTSCKKTDKCPPWKIRADKIQHNKAKKQIIYSNAWLEIYDFPIIYFPKFFHPDPSVQRQTGFLKPELGSSETLGSSVYIPYFYKISDNKDITIKPKLYNDKFLLQNEYRQKTKKSITITDFSFVKGHDFDPNDKNNTRSHFFTNTKIDLSMNNYLNSMLEINFEKASNDNYIKLFNLESPLLNGSNDVLESKIRLDLENQNYSLSTSIEMYETLGGSNSDRYQYVLPSYDFLKNFYLESLDGDFNFNSYGNNTLSDTNIATSSVSNDLNYTSFNSYFDNGIKANFEISLKNTNVVGKNSIQYKNSPQSELVSAYIYNASLPLIKKNEYSLSVFEPKLSLRLSPHDMKNNNALARRIEINNIFNSNRLSMDNSFEAGESVTLGFNYQKEKINIKNEISEIEEFLDIKLATVLRLNEENNLPINSTLNNKNSNIFGLINLVPNENISFNYNFSLTDDLKTFEYNSLTTKLNINNFSTQFNYLEERGVIGRQNVIENITAYNFDNENSISFNTRRNRKLNLTEYYDLVYEYKNDCLIAGIKYKKNYYNDDDIKPTEDLFFSITIIPLTNFSPDKMILK